jgi:hypothetical protein
MSKMSNLVLEIQEQIYSGKFTMEEIADKYEIPTKWVIDVCEMILDKDSNQDPFVYKPIDF